MFTVRRLEGNIFDMLMPAHRISNFSSSPNVVAVSTQLRHAWASPTPVNEDLEEITDTKKLTSCFGNYMVKFQNDKSAKRDFDADQETVHTPWRDALYTLWNHVFYDVSNFLGEVGIGIGHFHPPSEEVFALTYGKDVVVVKKWDTNVLFVPAVRKKGVVIHVVSMQKKEKKVAEKEEKEEEEEEEEEEDKSEKKAATENTSNKPEAESEGEDEYEEVPIGRFGGVNEDPVSDEREVGCERGDRECWWIKKDTEVRFRVEGEGEEGKLAAVIVWGKMCSESHVCENEENTEVSKEEPKEEVSKEEPKEELAEKLAKLKTEEKKDEETK